MENAVFRFNMVENIFLVGQSASQFSVAQKSFCQSIITLFAACFFAVVLCMFEAIRAINHGGIDNIETVIKVINFV